MTSLLRYTKELCRTFREVNGNLKLDTSSPIGRMKLKDDKIAFLSRYLNFVLNSGVLSKETKIYLNSIESSPRDAIRAYNKNNEQYPIDLKKISNHIYYDNKRLLELFPDDMLQNVVHKNVDIEVYRDILNSAVNKKAKKHFLRELSILDLTSVASNEKPDESDINTFIALLIPYTRKKVDKIQEEMPKNVIRYINYISSKTRPTDEEKEILNRLRNLDNEGQYSNYDDFDDLDIE